MPALKVCVCTSYAASDEPRGPRHAAAIANLGRDIEVVFIDCIPRGQPRTVPQIFAGVENLEYQTLRIAYRENGKARLLFDKCGYWFNRLLARTLGVFRAGALSTRAPKLERVLRKMNADVYMGYNIDTLAPISNAAARNNAKSIFDCQEFYSDMGSWQQPLDKELIRKAERKWLPECSLVLAASNEIANELAGVYGIKKPLAIYNAPPVETDLPAKTAEGFALYWRNSTINLSQRGLGDGLVALSLLPRDVTLHVQGRLLPDEAEKLQRCMEELGIADRVFIHPPYLPHEAISLAARYSVGLCLEQSGCRNHDLTVSNKMFDYMMAGLAVLSSDLPGLHDVIVRSRGGLLYQTGQADDLAAKLLTLYEDRNLLNELAANARSFALREGNLGFEARKLQQAFCSMVDSSSRVGAANCESHHAKADAVQFQS
jgi:glycosyltransferase involved in cell wall biosynthesis